MWLYEYSLTPPPPSSSCSICLLLTYLPNDTRHLDNKRLNSMFFSYAICEFRGGRSVLGRHVTTSTLYIVYLQVLGTLGSISYVLVVVKTRLDHPLGGWPAEVPIPPCSSQGPLSPIRLLKLRRHMLPFLWRIVSSRLSRPTGNW